MSPLLEREEELAALVRAVERARRGRGSLVLVGGEAGIGKTSLVRALRTRLDRSTPFIVGACEPLSVPSPLQPVRELATGAGAPELPALRSDDRLALATALIGLLARAAPTVALIEDAHWADPATLDVIRLLARRVEESPVVVVVTYRDDELPANAPLAQLVGDLVTGPAVLRVGLRPLSPGAIRALAEPAGIDPAELARLSGGNPLLVVEAIAAGGRLPASVRDATLARVGRLEPLARGAVDAAAVIGQRVPPAILALVAPGSEAGVEQALARGVLTDDGSTLGFRHELIRQAVESTIAAPRRVLLHARVLTALSAVGRHDDHARLAHHAEGAGLDAEAARHAVAAAAQAEQVGALAEAADQLDRALRAGSAAVPSRDRLDLLIRFSRAANFSGRVDDALAAAEEAVESAAALGDPRRHGRALGVLAAACWSLDRLPAAKRAAGEAVTMLERTGDVADLARAVAAAVRMEALAFDPAAAIAAGPRALRLATESGLEDVRVDVLVSVGLAHGHRGDAEAVPLLDEALAASFEARLHVQRIRAYVNAIGAALDARDHARVEALAAPARAFFADAQSVPPRDALAVDLAWSLLDRGRYDDALTTAASARESRFGFRPLRLALEGLIAARRGGAAAVPLLESAADELAGVSECRRHQVVRAALAEAAWLRGDLAAGRGHCRDGRSAPHADQFARTAGDLALWAMRCGDPVAAPPRAPAPALLELAGDWRGAARGWQALGAPYEAALATLAGDQRAAREAAAALQRLGAPAAARALARERAARGQSAPRGPRRSTLADTAGLTRREREILGHVASGTTNRGIATALHLSERTVGHHVSAVLRKLDVPTRTAAVSEARRRGLLPQDGSATDAT